MASDIERRGGGSQLLVQDDASEGEPIEPNRLAISAMGSLVGCAVGGTAAFGLHRKQRRVLA
jgi:hypothetical protein